MDANPIPLVKENKQVVKQNKPTPTKNNFTISNQKKLKTTLTQIKVILKLLIAT